MNRGLVFAVAMAALLAAVLSSPTPDGETYSTKYDNINLDEILQSTRLYKNYFQCLSADADTSCTPDGKFLRATIPDALKTQCAKCNEKQKTMVKKILDEVKANHPDDYKVVVVKWDPNNEYIDKFVAIFKS